MGTRRSGARRWLVAAGAALVVGASTAVAPVAAAGASESPGPSATSAVTAASAGQLSPRLLQVAPPNVRTFGSASFAARASGKSAYPVSLPPTGAGSMMRQADGRYVVKVQVSDASDATQDRLRATGATIVSVNPEVSTITVAAAPEQLSSVAGVSGVRYVSEELTPRTNAACPTGTVDEGDAQLAANNARSMFDVDGTGVKVGLLSDSYNKQGGEAADVAGGDLPGNGNSCGFPKPVSVVADAQSGSMNDEGRAMSQIVHDLAPNADLSFATANGGQGAMANNIRALSNGGANVIVDDVTYLDEPLYQDGVIARAVDDVTAGGTTYFSSAGNANVTIGGHDVASYEATGGYRPMGCPAAVLALTGPGPDCHDFNPGVGNDNDDTIALAAGGSFAVQLGWSEPEGGVSTDLDILAFDDLGRLVGASGDVNPTSGEPVEFFGVYNDTGVTQNVHIVVPRFGGATPRFKFIFQGSSGITSAEYTTSTGGDVLGPAISGHNAARVAGTIGAIPFNNAGVAEPYSSKGPATYCWQPVGNILIPGAGPPSAPINPCQTKAVDVAATDGAANSFFGSFVGGAFRFFGTSAAAPHAAAVAALQIQNSPCRTPAEILKGQRDGAVSIGNPGATGSGRLNAVTAIQNTAACPATHFSASGPTEATKNVPAYVTVEALDNTNHVDRHYAGTVHFTTTDGAATLPANTTLTQGVGQFPVTFQTLGSQTVTATDTLVGSINGTTGPIVVANPFGYHPIAPVRILESRPQFSPKQYSSPWTAGLDRPVVVTGTITGGAVPDTATAVVLNVTAVNPTTSSDLRIYPTGQPRPNSSSLNFVANEVIPNLVVARVGTGHTIQIFNNSGNVDVIADVVGWYDNGVSPGGGDLYHPLAPTRILETRPAFGALQYSSPWTGGLDRPVQVRGGTTTVPANATAVVLNVTAVNPSTSSDLRIYPSGTTRPNSSNLNFVAGEVVPNLVISQIGADGNIRIFNNQGNVDVLADVVGYFTAAATGGGPFHPLAPSRVLESRAQFNPIQYFSPWGAGTDRSVQITGDSVPGNVPPNATAVVLNVTAVFPSSTSDLRVYPTGQPRPNASNLNFVPGQVIPNLVIVGIGAGGKIQIYNNAGNVNVIADVVGYFT